MDEKVAKLKHGISLLECDVRRLYDDLNHLNDFQECFSPTIIQQAEESIHNLEMAVIAMRSAMESFYIETVYAPPDFFGRLPLDSIF